ncbi:MAG: hypoxanthine phosphoribosyltransferase [Bacteroidetes bacterium QS_8_68_28]|jgi:hypoxanthine phosphoribosyltransferase|nr:MAG: hypoxanthine phosphoribosyltransferase [Bacteroidetes bacterium QS_8_68_28]
MLPDERSATTAPGDAQASVTCRGERFDLYLPAREIGARVEELGAALSRDLQGERPILIGVLNGAFVFIADLMRALSIECEVDFMKLSSYGAEKVSSGEVTELKRIDADLEGRHVVLVEDIVDTGLTMQFILNRLETLGPASVRVATLLHKKEATEKDVPLDYVGFEIPDRFVIGYGLDYGQLARRLPAIYALAEEER